MKDDKWWIESDNKYGKMSGRGLQSLAKSIAVLGSSIQGKVKLFVYVGNRNTLPAATTIGMFLDRCDPELRKDLLPFLVKEQQAIMVG